MIKRLVALPFIALASIAAKQTPPPAKPPVTITAPAEIAADPANKWSLELSNGSKVVILLRPDVAPQHVYRIQQLTTQGFYDGLTFHRVIPGFMAQGGDPNGTGQGGSPLPDLAAEFNDLPHLRGVASMARADEPNSANSQFFIMLAPRFALDHKYSAFGRVIEGMAAVDAIAVGEPPAQPTRIVRATIGGPLPAPPPVTVTAASTAATPATVDAAAGASAQPVQAAESEAAPATSPPTAAAADAADAASTEPSPAATPAEAVAGPEPADPAPEAIAEEVPTQDAPVQAAPTQDAPEQDESEQDESEQDATAQEVPSQDAPAQEALTPQ